MWFVSKIEEADYGCEERMPGEPLMALVSLESDDGRVCQLEVSEDWLYIQGLEEGDGSLGTNSLRVMDLSMKSMVYLTK